MDELAAARWHALDAHQGGIAGRLMRLEDPHDVTRLVGRLFNDREAATIMRPLARRVGGNEDARQGLRKAVADVITHRFVAGTEAATSGNGTLGSDAFRCFVRDYRKKTS